MNVRAAESADREQIRAITHDSLHASYSLSPAQIESILKTEFTDLSLERLLNDTETVVLVVNETVDGVEKLFGFMTVEMGADATIRWLHVDPAGRGGGIATAMVDHVRETAGEKPIAACILDHAVEGGRFLEAFGLREDGNDEITVGTESFDVTLFAEGDPTVSGALSGEPTVSIPDSVTVDGADRPLSDEESVPGSKSPFVTIYCGGETAAPYGFFCSECGGTNVSADGHNRLECGDCGNVHLAEDWDDAYL